MSSELNNLNINIKKPIEFKIVRGRKNIVKTSNTIIKGGERAQIGSLKSVIPNLDKLPFVDRTLVDYKKYHKYVSHAGRKNFMAIQRREVALINVFTVIYIKQQLFIIEDLWIIFLKNAK